MAVATGALKGRASAPSLRRSVTAWGSYSWGYADVGADIYVALGVVIAFAAGAANVAFLFAGVVYVCIGLAYTELAAAYPVAGGGQFFVTRALGDFMGFVAGWAVLLDFTIDIALFAVFTIGYLSALPGLSAFIHHNAYWTLVFLVVAFLTLLNIKGVHESTRLNAIVSVIDVCNETLILFCGFLLAWHPQILVHSMMSAWPSTDNLLKGISIAIISFVGLESISHAAEETQRPSSIMPRTSVGLILTILIFALAYSNLVLGMPSVDTPQGSLTMMHYVSNTEHQDKAVAALSSQIPVLGSLFALYVPLVGAMLLLISSNSGVFGASRIAYSMGAYQLLPSWFQRTNQRTRTPIQTILVFSGIAAVWLIFAYLQDKEAIAFLADMYAFGAALSYMLVFVALITLRFTDSIAPRRFRMGWNVPVTIRGVTGDVSLVSVIGLIGISAILIFTLLTHPIGRIAGPTWVVLGIALYAIFRMRTGKPVAASLPRDWARLHKQTLTAAGELEMLDEYAKAVDEKTAPSKA